LKKEGKLVLSETEVIRNSEGFTKQFTWTEKGDDHLNTEEFKNLHVDGV